MTISLANLPFDGVETEMVVLTFSRTTVIVDSRVR